LRYFPRFADPITKVGETLKDFAGKPNELTALPESTVSSPLLLRSPQAVDKTTTQATMRGAGPPPIQGLERCRGEPTNLALLRSIAWSVRAQELGHRRLHVIDDDASILHL